MPYHRPGEWQPAKDLHKDISENLRSKLSFGESKHAAKIAGSAQDKIYSSATYETYARACHTFADYVIEQNDGNRHITVDAAREYAQSYIEREIDLGKSPYTIKMERAALAKLFGCEGKEICAVTPQRVRTEITRSKNRTAISEKTGKEIKNQSTRAGHFSEKNHQEIVNFASGTGLRRSELSKVRGDQLIERNGSYSVALEGSQCKGGRPRESRIIGEHIDEIVAKFRAAGSEKIWSSVSAAMDVHYYRGEYAKTMYREIARDVEKIPRKERYDCRGDLQGLHYDKKALAEVSQNLGHNRLRVVVDNYLR